MAKVQEQPPSSEHSSDNEEIQRLFPKCRPRSSSSSDLNQNRLHSDSSCGILLQGDQLNENFLHESSVILDCLESKRNLSDLGRKITKMPHSEDSVVPASEPEDSLAYHINMRPTSVALRESRIEVAGGREVFSKSRCKPSKKRFSDEVIYHPPPLPEDTGVKTSDVLYDDTFVQYIYGLQSQKVESIKAEINSQQCGSKKQSSKQVEDAGLESSLSGTSQLVYETPVHNAEVVYDDIGDLMKQQEQESPEDTSISQETNENRVGMTSSEVEVSFTKEEDLDMKASSSSKGSLLTDDGSAPPSPAIQKIARVIGNLPIAEYEGSPKRYGPRPGYPQRISDQCSEDQVSNSGSSSSTQRTSKGAEHFTLPILNAYYLNASDEPGDICPALPLPVESVTQTNGEDETSVVPTVMATTNGRHSRQNHYNHMHMQVGVSPSEFNDLDYKLYRVNAGNSYIGKRLAHSSDADFQDSPKTRHSRYCNNNNTPVNGIDDHSQPNCPSVNVSDFAGNNTLADSPTPYLPNEQELMLLHERVHQHTLNVVDMCEHDRDSLSTLPGTEDLGETEVGEQVDNTRNFTLSPETTDCDSNDVESEVSYEGSLNSSGRLLNSMPILEDGLSSGHSSDAECGDGHGGQLKQSSIVGLRNEEDNDLSAEAWRQDSAAVLLMNRQISEIEAEIAKHASLRKLEGQNKKKVEEYLRKHTTNQFLYTLPDSDLDYFETLDHHLAGERVHESGELDEDQEHKPRGTNSCTRESVSDVIREIKQAIQHSKSLHLMTPPATSESLQEQSSEPVWVPRMSPSNHAPEERDGHSLDHPPEDDECDTDQETDRLLGAQRAEDKNFTDDKGSGGKKKNASKEVLIHEPAVLIEGVLFRARYLGSTQLVCEGQPTKATRMMQAEEAVSRIKSLAPEGETQPSTEVDLFISTEKIMVLNTDLKEIMMDHSLRTISYIADIGDLVVLMARRRLLNTADDLSDTKLKRTPKMICHVFESEEAQFIAQSIGQAFQVAYMEFLKANGIEDSSFVKEMDYQEVLNSQEIFGNELEMFAKKEKQKEVVVPKQKGEILGMVIVESGWGSMLPTVVIANMAQTGPAARCGQLNIGDQIIAINGVSLVGLPLSTCQNYIKNTKTQTVVKLTVVPCAPVVEVKIKRPDTKYQLGFSVQNGVICSLLRGGIAERGGVRVGHRIIEINGQSVVAVPHEKIVNLLATSVGEILMKTMPTSMFRLLTGQEVPVFI